MNLSCLLFVNHGITGGRARGNPFQAVEPDRLSFLATVEPPGTAPVKPALESGASPEPRRRPAGLSQSVETLLVRLIVILLALAAIGCGFGVQHVAYTRERNRLYQQLRQNELEIRKCRQACRSLESCLAVRAAQEQQIPGRPFVASKAATLKTGTRS